MQTEIKGAEEKTHGTLLPRILKAIPVKYIILILLVAVLSIGCTIGITNGFSTKNKTTKLGFEDIGQLVTQAAYCTKVNVIDDPRKFWWGSEIPFTQSKYIYSYDYIIKAGFNFSRITLKTNDTTIIVNIPEVEIISNDIVDNSLEIFYEKESVFSKITLTEQNEANTKMKQDALNDAVANGLYENAKANAETLLTGFFGNTYDLTTYAIKFVHA